MTNNELQEVLADLVVYFADSLLDFAMSGGKTWIPENMERVAQDAVNRFTLPTAPFAEKEKLTTWLVNYYINTMEKEMGVDWRGLVKLINTVRDDLSKQELPS